MKHLKEEFDSLSLKEMLVYLLAFITMVSAIVLVCLGLYLEPSGEIHGSVLTYFGLSCGFCSVALGISAHYSNELARFKSQIMDVMRQMDAGQAELAAPTSFATKRTTAGKANED